MGPQEYFKKMRDHFNIEDPDNYFDQFYLRNREIKIDIIKFDNWLHGAIGNYEEHDMDMGDALTHFYGSDACYFIKCLL
jgi:hypothetical protein